MKKLLLSLTTIAALSVSAFGADQEKEGFLTTKWCAERGMFADCKTESVFCGYEGCYKDVEFKVDVDVKNIVLYVHDEGKYYHTKYPHGKDGHGIHMGHFLESSMNRNEVTLIGKIKGDVIEVHDFKSPPPPKKSFFKGCL